jgi:predicted phosphate transport protein (TIGR00153 family)
VHLLSKLVPREGRFYELFNRQASLVAEAGREMEALIKDYDDTSVRDRRVARILDLEHDGDRVTHETITLLHTIFVTPFDRDDILRLISRLDDVLDLLQDTAESLVLYDVQKITPEASELASLLQRCCQRVQAAVALLNSMNNGPEMMKLCHEIDMMESEADRVMRTAISKLFRDETDTRQLIKLKAVYELLESATDKCQDVANVIESVVIENS